jgi:anti-sigma regulatory factor (Ser/Thr protein kinase)/biotin operon repressor
MRYRVSSTKEQIIALLGADPTSVGALAAALDLTPQAIFYHLATLRTEGVVAQVGKGRGARWVRRFDHRLVWDLGAGGDIAEFEMWQQARDLMAAELATASAQTLEILNYTATEILNNAIDHSEGTKVELLAACHADDIEITISDNGVGAFRKVQDHFGLSNELEAIAHIAKGQQTTWEARHTGQGLFFSSRAVDVFTVESGGRIWEVDNVREDTTVLPGVRRPGTKVVLRIRKSQTLTLKELFDRYSIEEYAFDRGAVRVVLSDHGNEFVSRSEAKRLGVGLELYGEVELDFTNVRAVGQGFVDELFRVWVREHPGTSFTYVNASEEVAFMIERGLPKR